MVKAKRSAARQSAARRRHRARIVAALLKICRSMERFEVSPEARLACRDVAGLLGAALAEAKGRK